MKNNKDQKFDRDGAELHIGDEVIVMQYKTYLHRCVITRFTPQMVAVKILKTGVEIRQYGHYILKSGEKPVWRKIITEGAPKSPGTYLARYENGFAREMYWNFDKKKWEDPWDEGCLDDIVEWTEIPK